jgi:type I restriction enzyme S subunit
MSSETLDDIGKSAVYLGSQEVYLNSFCKGFQFKEKNNAKYVNYLLNSNSYRTYFSLYGRGFTRINIKQEYINNVHIIEIKSHEQQQIANFLDKKTAQIDEAINLKKSEITKLKEYKTTLIDSAVTGKIKV